jgi:hypothetical protein
MYGEEKIICAAIWYKELPTQEVHRCTNTPTGVVICGWRHGNIIATCKILTGKRTVTHAEDGVGEHEQGFLTSHNRFVDRGEAWEIAKKQNQIVRVTGGEGTLYSEDIY